MKRLALILAAVLSSHAFADDWCQLTRPALHSPTLTSLAQTGAKRRVIGTRPIEIDVMEVYGPWLVRIAGSADAAEALIRYQIETTNAALSDSGLSHIHLRLRHARFSQDYDKFPSDKLPGPELESDRQYYGADLLGFAVGETPFGIAGAACRPPAYGPGCGVHWVHVGNFTMFPLAFTHEIGHNLGADHDAPNAPPRDTDPHPFARAHCVPGLWRTVMSYGEPCHANALLIFSNPRRTVGGLASGITDEADNARAISIVAPFVRDYYPATTNTGRRCEFRITFDDSDVPAAGISRTVVAERTRGNCEPAIAPLEDWIRVEIAPASTPERAEAVVTFLPNDRAPSRRGHFVVGEQPLSVDQTGTVACAAPNGTFDRDVAGWTPRRETGTAAWSPLNAKDGANSGSAALTTSTQFVLERCIAIEPATQYLVQSRVYIPPGQNAGPNDFPALVSAAIYPTTDCSGEPLTDGGNFIRNIPGSWFPIEYPLITAHPGHPITRSVRIALSVSVTSGEPFTTHFDDISLCKLE